MDKIFAEIFNNEGEPRHHTFLLTGDGAVLPRLVAAELVATNLASITDINVLVFDRLKIEAARAMRARLGAPLAGAWRFTVVGFNELGEEAEQSLLKILEEPLTQNIFILITSRPQSLKSTILSRVWPVVAAVEAIEIDWLELNSPAERLAAAEKVAAKLEESEESKRAYAWRVLAAAETSLVARAKKGETPPLGVAAVDLLRQALSRGHRLSLKNLLAYLALVWPGR